MPLQDGVFPIRTEDYAHTVDVWEASVRATHDFVTETDIEIFRPLVLASLPVGHVTCVRDTEGQVAGFIGVDKENVDMLFIGPEWRGQGAGKRLMTYAIESLGCKTVDVNEQNPQAIGFYLRMGFEVVGRTELDGLGKPYPLLYMRLKGSSGFTSPPSPLSARREGEH